MFKLNKILYFIPIFLQILFICSLAYGKSLDSGIPLPKEYTKEIVAEYLGKKITVVYVNNNLENKIILNVIGVLLDRQDNTKFLLLGKTEFKNKIVIPIEKIKEIY